MRALPENAAATLRKVGTGLVVFSLGVFLLPVIGLEWKLIRFLGDAQPVVALIAGLVGGALLIVSWLDNLPVGLGAGGLSAVAAMVLFATAPGQPAATREPLADANPRRHERTQPPVPQARQNANDAIMQDAIDSFDRLADAYSRIVDANSARTAARDIYPIELRRDELQQNLENLKRRATPAENQRLEEAYGARLAESIQRLTYQVKRVNTIPAASAAIEQEFAQIAGSERPEATLQAASEEGPEDETAPAEPEATPNAAPQSQGSPVNLLALIEPARNQLQGRWEFQGDALVVPATNPARLQIPWLPTEEYELTAVVERRSGNESFSGMLVVGGHQVLAIIDGYGGRTSGLNLIDGKTCENNETTRRGQFLTGNRPNTIVYTVRSNSVQVVCNGRDVINWSGDPARFSVGRFWNSGVTPGRLLIGSWGTSYIIRRLDVMPLQ